MDELALGKIVNGVAKNIVKNIAKNVAKNLALPTKNSMNAMVGTPGR